jgi:3'-phosphoadenosine 5'-phosphosulfate (PAPS) 3'-phosphatase
MKIFGIGLSKTGTSSLAQALIILGYKTKDFPGLRNYAPGDLATIDPGLLDKFDALTDTPIPSFFRELDARFPDAKFILTVRDREGWLKSCKKQFNQKLADKQNEAHNRLFMDLYGCTVFDEERFIAGYEKHTQAVLNYFRGRPDKLLTMNVVAGDGWEKLCPYLSKPIPKIPFPKANVTKIRWMKVEDLVQTAKEAGNVLLTMHNLIAAGDTSHNQGTLSLKTLIERLWKGYAELRGGRKYAMNRASLTANSVILDRLSKLNPDIPIISSLMEIPDNHKRTKWNHFWLVDPLDGADGFAAATGEFSVNIALIEDRKPVYGVVHAPLSSTTYYAVSGKSGFKCIEGEPPRRLDASQPSQPDKFRTTPASKALKLCLLAEGASESKSFIFESSEWHSAAAQVVAQAYGKRVVDCESQEVLTYNKPKLKNNAIAVR